MSRKKHILVFRLSAMGDVAMIVPVIRAFVSQNPDVQITVASRAFLQPLFEGIQNVDFFAVDTKSKHKGFLGIVRLAKQLSMLEITHFADLHDVLRSKIIRFLLSFTNISIANIDKGRKEKKALVRTENKIFKQLKTTHERYADVFRELGFSLELSEDTILPITRKDIPQEILEITGEKQQKWIGIAPFATHISKTYPLDFMEKVIEKLSCNGYKLFLFGGKNEQSILETIANKYESTISLANKLGGLQNELILISHLDCMISMDSGNGHFAAMQQVKTLTIWGGTHPYAGFAPYNQPKEYSILPDLHKYPKLPCSIYGNNIVEGYENVMRSISPEIIVEKVNAILS